MLSLDEVRVAQERLQGVCVRTPVLRFDELDEAVGATVWLKAESLQLTGSFKFRGAYNAVASLTATERASGVCTVSSGNHGQALALAGRMLSSSVRVHLPSDAPRTKVDAIRTQGADVVLFDRYAVSQADLSDELVRDGKPLYISAHDDTRVMAGAGTIALEFFDQVAHLDTIVVPVGGGGGIAGIGSVAKVLNPECRILGAEPAASEVNRRSLLAGHRIQVALPRTIADGQILTTPGALTFPIMCDVVNEIVLVTERQIRNAVRFLHNQCGITVEPSPQISESAAGSMPRSR